MATASLHASELASDNAGLAVRRAAAVPNGIVSATPAYAARARNAEVWDVDGNRYIDFVAGIAVCSTGHCHPRVIAAVQDQLERFTHTSFQVLPYAPYVALAERLNALVPIDGAAKTLFFNSGAEAVENAVKIARHATARSGVVAFAGAFHGRTLMTTALTGKAMPYKRGFGTLPGDVWRVPFPIAHYGVSVQDSLDALHTLFRTDADPGSIAAIIIEPVQGEGGFHVTPPELLRALRAICSEHGILLICDEVQTGFARTGKLFAVEHSGIAPDIVTMAKALGGDLFLGFLSAVAFATILAVVSGLALAGASAISHDIYARVIRKGKATEKEEMRVSKLASLALGVVAVVLGILFEKQNVSPFL